MPVHFLDLASAVEKLRWAEKEWRELNQNVRAASATPSAEVAISMSPPDDSAHDLVGVTAEGRRG